MFEILLVDHLLTLFLYYRNYDFVFTFHIKTIISILLINNSKWHTEKCPWEYNLNLPSNVASKTIGKKNVFKENTLPLFEKEKKSPYLTVKCHKILQLVTKKKKNKCLSSVHSVFLCIAVPPAGVKEPLFLHTVFFSSWSGTSHQSENDRTSENPDNCKASFESQKT